MTDHLPIDAVAPIAPSAPPATPPVDAGADAGFRALLERLEGLVRPTAPPPAGDLGLEAFSRALQQAEHDYSTAMDLRRQLEDAFRQRAP
jgi:hypothetical protein